MLQWLCRCIAPCSMKTCLAVAAQGHLEALFVHLLAGQSGCLPGQYNSHGAVCKL